MSFFIALEIFFLIRGQKMQKIPLYWIIISARKAVIVLGWITWDWTDPQEISISKVIDNSIQKILSENNELLLDDDKAYREFEKIYNREKIKTIYHHFMALPANPMLVRTIFKKIFHFVKLLILRTKGQKIRW